MARRPFYVITDRGQANFADLAPAVARARRQAATDDDSRVYHRGLRGFLSVPESGPVVVHGEGTIHETDWVNACRRANLDHVVDGVDGTDSAAPKYPELEKLRAVSAVSNAQGTFVNWLASKGYHLGAWHCPHGYQPPTACEESKKCARGDGGQELWPVHLPMEQLLAEYHDIDLAKVNAEREALIDRQRAANADANAASGADAGVGAGLGGV